MPRFFTLASVSSLALLAGIALFCFAAEPFVFTVPKGLPPLKIPQTNPMTAEKIELGRQLYFDKRLSRDMTVSCASCHDPEKGWSNGDKVAAGIEGKKGGRSAPTIINSAYFPAQFWDGRASELEGQALGPIQNPIEMDLPLDEMVKRLNGIPGYRKQFQAIFGTDATSKAVAEAIASFERTILSGDAPYDRYVAGDKTALTDAAQRGRALFFGKAHCSACHSGPSFSDGAFHNIGVGCHIDPKSPADLGRSIVTKLDGDKAAFKTPTLREIARTAPYMHDGSEPTLEAVVDYYDKGGHANEWLDEEIFALKLTPEEKADLVTFMKEGLSSASYPNVKAPKLPE